MGDTYFISLSNAAIQETRQMKKDTSARIALIVPCYNEEANIVPFYEAAMAPVFQRGRKASPC